MINGKSSVSVSTYEEVNICSVVLLMCNVLYRRQYKQKSACSLSMGIVCIEWGSVPNGTRFV